MKTFFAWIGALSVGFLLTGVFGIQDVRVCFGAVGTCNGPTHTSGGAK